MFESIESRRWITDRLDAFCRRLLLLRVAQDALAACKDRGADLEQALARIQGLRLPAKSGAGLRLQGWDELEEAADAQVDDWLIPGWAEFVDPAIAEATRAAEVQLAKLAAKAKAGIEAERDAALSRLKLSLTHQGLDAAAIEAQLAAERAHYDRLLDALTGLKVVPDSVAGFVLNR